MQTKTKDMLIPLIWSAISTISRAMALPPAASSLSLASASASLRDNANMNACAFSFASSSV